MKTVKSKEAINLQVPGEPLPDKELARLVKEAETGPFYTPEEFEARFDQWKREKGYS
jgi:hypothetical protein